MPIPAFKPPLNFSDQQNQINEIFDCFRRPLRVLRLSVTDRCNFRCSYCLPESTGSAHSFFKKSQCLNLGEIIRLVKLFAKLGVTKVRLTGGEPLLYPQLALLIKNISKISGIKDLALTTNGSLLKNQADELKTAGLHRLTVSLDSLDKNTFRQMRGQKSSVNKVLDGIQSAQAAGFERIKINVVIQKGVNESAIFDLIERFRGTTHVLRFIEYMDVGNLNHWQSTAVVPSNAIRESIEERYPLVALAATDAGEVAERFRFRDGKGEIGFISAVTKPFCPSCTRARLSIDGKIYTCLFAGEGTDILTPLRNGASDQELLELMTNAWQSRADKYSENRSLFQALKENMEKVEMFKIGG